MRVKVFLLTAVTAALFAVPAANADLIGGLLGTVTQVVLPTCGTATPVFKNVDGDKNSYYGFSNNGLESGSNAWSLSGGAYVGFGNEPWNVNGFGARSLVLPPGASATSPGFCINLLDPAVRMFAKGTNGGDLKIQVIFHGITGNVTGIFNRSDELGTGRWDATDPTSSGLALPLLTAYATIKVTAVSGTFNVDDLEVDPWVVGVG